MKGVIKMILEYNNEQERYNNFHCGESFKIKVNDKWKIVRIEKSQNWYVIDQDNFRCSCKQLEGCEIEEID